MSVYITQEPQFLTPSDNPIIYVFSTGTYQASGPEKYKLSFLVKVFLQDFGEIGVFEIYPEAFANSSSYGKIDISNIIRSYLKLPDIVPTNYASNNIFNSIVNTKQANILVYEKWSNTIDGQTTLRGSVVSSITTVFKGSLSEKEFLNFNVYDYNVGGVNKKFLTDKPLVDLIPPFNIFGYKYNFLKDDSIHMSFFDIDVLNEVNYDKTLRVIYQTSTGFFNFEILYTYDQQGVYNSICINLKTFVDYGYLTQADADDIISMSVAIKNTNTDVIILAPIFIDIIKPCFYPGKSLKFLNKFGAFDYFLFEHNERKSALIKSYEYERKNGYFYPQLGEFRIDQLRDGKQSYLKQTSEKLQLVSGYLDQAEQNWLTQLYESPLVYLNYKKGDVQSVIITNTSYTIKQDQYDELYNEIVEIEFTTKNSIEL